jgi:hypothetical protein
MIGTSRSFEHRGVAIDRSHLMPVETPADRRFNHTCYILGSAVLIVVMVADYLGAF